MVEHDAGWNPEPATSPRVRQRQMYVCRECIRQPLESERGLVRDHAGAFRPEPDRDQFFVLTGGEVDESVYASASPNDAAGADVLEQQLGRVAGSGGLPGCEVPLLCAGDLEQEVPTWSLR
jgi:hypothetical protein